MLLSSDACEEKSHINACERTRKRLKLKNKAMILSETELTFEKRELNDEHLR